MKKKLRRGCAFIIGVIFFLAGIFKLMDPIGASLVIKEYLKFFHLPFLLFASKFFAISFALIETLLGLALVSGVFRKVTAIIALSTNVFFTLLTAILLIFNPQFDCGCFGEFIHLNHLQTFVKNIVLLALSLFAFLPLKSLGVNKKRKYFVFSLISTITLGFCIYSCLNIPLVDYTDFTIGSELGKKSTNLHIFNESNSECDYLVQEGKVFTISIYETTKLNNKEWEKIASFIEACSNKGLAPFCLLAQTPEDFNDNLEKLQIPIISKQILKQYSYFADYKTLISLNRGNAGICLFEDGLLIQKLSIKNIPSEQELDKISESEHNIERMLEASKNSRLKFHIFLFSLLAIMILI